MGYVTVESTTTPLIQQEALLKDGEVLPDDRWKEEIEGDGQVALTVTPGTQPGDVRVLRPPRDVLGIFFAGSAVLLGILMGAVTGYFLWTTFNSMQFLEDICTVPTDTTTTAAPWVPPPGVPPPPPPPGVPPPPPPAPATTTNVAGEGLWDNRLTRPMVRLYCSAIRDSIIPLIGATLGGAGIAGLACLRMCYGRAYFSEWSEAETLNELERLYTVRTYGALSVLRTWRARVAIEFCVDIVIVLWLRYNIDLYLDMQAMYIFYEHDDILFLMSNLGGVYLGLVWTMIEMFKILRNESSKNILPPHQVLLVGITLPLVGLHVTYLSALSLWLGYKHQFLFISTLAEAILESSISCLVQTYAVLGRPLCVEGEIGKECISWSSKMSLYQSIVMSFVSIGHAFASLDKAYGGELLVNVPGFCRKEHGMFYGVVGMFRVAEITSRATSIALFSYVTRPWGIVILGASDLVVMIVLTLISQFIICRNALPSERWAAFAFGNLVYAVPSVVCLMAPLLESDTVLTMPAELYYTVRFLELGAMVYFAGDKLDWDLEKLEDKFFDDGLIVALFLLSTIGMLVLFPVIRGILKVRVLLEAPLEVWQSRPFNDVQKALRNRILMQFPHAEDEQAWQIRDVLTKQLELPTWKVQKKIGLKHASRAARGEWEAKFLRAKVAIALARSLQALEEATKLDFDVTKDHATGSESKSKAGLEDLQKGALVSIKCPAGYFTNQEGWTVPHWSTDCSDQQFVLEPLEEDERGDFLTSGVKMRLRSLSDGRFVRFNPRLNLPSMPFSLGFLDQGWGAKSEPLGEDTVLSIAHCHVERFSSAKRFADRVKMVSNSLAVNELKAPRKLGTQSWDPHGWRVLLIDGQKATQEKVKSILQEAATTGVRHHGGGGGGGGDGEGSGSEQSSEMDQADAAAIAALGEKKPGFEVCFEKIGGQLQMAWGCRVIIRAGGEGWAQDSFVGVKEPTAEAASRSSTKVGVAEAGGMASFESAAYVRDTEVGSVFTIERVEYGAKDDGALYKWAAENIRTRRDALVLKASLAEKYRIATVVASNARSAVVGAQGILRNDPVLHKTLLKHLCGYIRSNRCHEVTYDAMVSIEEEMTLNKVQVQHLFEPVVVESLTEEDNEAGKQGIRAQDELIQLELIDTSENVVLELFKSSKEIRQCLGLTTDGQKGVQIEEGIALKLTFQSKSPNPVDNEVRRVAVQEAISIASLVPSWEEIKNLGTSKQEEIAEAVSEAKLQILTHNNMFDLRCSLIRHLLEYGWEMQHTAFFNSAVALHRSLQTAPLRKPEEFDPNSGYEPPLDLETLFPGDDESIKKLRNEILIQQLDVLTIAWQNTPRSIKEGSPAKLRELFRPDVELRALVDAVELEYDNWKGDSNDDTDGLGSSVEMPPGLHNFLARVRPVNNEVATPDPSSASWIQKAWNDQRKEFAGKPAEKVVREILDRLKKYYNLAFKYWEKRLSAASLRLETTQRNLDVGLNSNEGVRVVFIATESDLSTIQGRLDPRTLKMRMEAVVTDPQTKAKTTIPPGAKLLIPDMGEDDDETQERRAVFHKDLIKNSDFNSGDVALRFSTDDWETRFGEARVALHEVQNVLQLVKKAAHAFPELTIEYEEVHMKCTEAKKQKTKSWGERNLQFQKQEAHVGIQTGNLKLKLAEEKRKQLEAENRRLDEEKQAIQTEKDRVEEEKAELERKQVQLEQDLVQVGKEKERLEKEKAALEESQKLLEAGLREVEAKAEELNRQKEEVTADRDSLKVQKETLEKEKADLQKKSQKLKEDKDQVEKDKKQLENDFAVLRKEQETLKEKQDDLVQSIRNMDKFLDQKAKDEREAAEQSGGDGMMGALSKMVKGMLTLA